MSKIIRYRVIKIEVEDEQQLNHQLSNSLATGIHTGNNISIYVGNWSDISPVTSSYFNRLQNTGVAGAITQQQLNTLKVKDIDKS